MPKVIKGNAGRKPPEPSADHADIDEWCRRLAPDLRTIIKELDEVIVATLSDLQYSVRRNRGYYGTAELGWLIELAPYYVSANVVFFGGAEFASPPTLGSADRTRYVKVKSLDDVQRPELKMWIEQAGRTPGWK
jgi:hypothetical protein